MDGGADNGFQMPIMCNGLRLKERPLESMKRLCHRTTRQDGFAVFRHGLHVQLLRNLKLREPEMSTGRGRGAEKWISTLRRRNSKPDPGRAYTI